MSVKPFLRLFVVSAAILTWPARADDPDPPSRSAGEAVKMEVTRFTDRDGSKTRAIAVATEADWEVVRKLLAHFPELSSGTRPGAGRPAPGGLSYNVVLRLAEGRPVHIFVRDDGRRWLCYPGTADLRGDWALKKPMETAKFLDGLLGRK